VVTGREVGERETKGMVVTGREVGGREVMGREGRGKGLKGYLVGEEHSLDVEKDWMQMH
jgi:hypothetical protein